MMQIRVVWRVDVMALGCLACCQAFAVACQSDRGDGDSMTIGLTSEGGAGSGAEPPPAFEEVYAVMQASCGGGMSGCHITGMSASLAMPDADAAYAVLVDVASSKCAGETRVVPGDPDASLLVQVLENTTACVKPMPLGRDPLSEADVELVRAWIEAGALPD